MSLTTWLKTWIILTSFHAFEPRPPPPSRLIPRSTAAVGGRHRLYPSWVRNVRRSSKTWIFENGHVIIRIRETVHILQLNKYYIITYRTGGDVSDTVVGRIVDVNEIAGRRQTEPRVLDLQPSASGGSHLDGAFVLFFQVFSCNTTGSYSISTRRPGIIIIYLVESCSNRFGSILFLRLKRLLGLIMGSKKNLTIFKMFEKINFWKINRGVLKTIVVGRS